MATSVCDIIQPILSCSKAIQQLFFPVTFALVGRKENCSAEQGTDDPLSYVFLMVIKPVSLRSVCEADTVYELSPSV